MTTPAAAFYQRAERERGRLGMTKSDLAARTGLGRNTYDRLATQDNPARPATILAIAGALGMDVDEALDLAGIGSAPAQQRQRVEVSIEEALVAALQRRLPDLDGATIARVLSTTADLLQSTADLLDDQEGHAS
ncbi:helix-turn-helix domain-containing protein [Streptosporangium canum]|uniref:helix-turn-helix domain-containing protein n=1 Tax=Streptosporangium canum TaxID=324952 RepID=UPI0033A69FD6